MFLHSGSLPSFLEVKETGLTIQGIEACPERVEGGQNGAPTANSDRAFSLVLLLGV
jgi:hypothetical protein